MSTTQPASQAAGPWRKAPRLVRTGFVLVVLGAVGLLLSGILMWTAEPPTDPGPEQRRVIDAVVTALRWTGGIEILAAVVLSAASPGLLLGDPRRRTVTAVAAGVAALTALGIWALGIGGPVQPLLAFILAGAVLAVYRPAVRFHFRPGRGTS